MLEEEWYQSAAEIAEAEGRLTLLAPDIVEAILDGLRPTKGMALEELTRAIPSGREEQRGIIN